MGILTGGTLYNSLHLLVLARRSCERMTDYPYEGQTAVVLAAMALEGFLNDLAHLAESAQAIEPSPVCANLGAVLKETEEERASVLLKIKLGYLAMSGALPDAGSQPFQDIELLFRLRNLLVHSGPELVEFGQPGVVPDLPKIVERFARRGVIDRPGPGAAKAWRQYVLVPPVGVWAHNTAVRAIKWLIAVAPADGLRPLLELLAKDVSEIAAQQP